MQTSTAKKERNMGVELLRIVSMLMVVVLHILGQGGVLAVPYGRTPDTLPWYTHWDALSTEVRYRLRKQDAC